MTWGWVNDQEILIWKWTNRLNTMNPESCSISNALHSSSVWISGCNDSRLFCDAGSCSDSDQQLALECLGFCGIRRTELHKHEKHCHGNRLRCAKVSLSLQPLYPSVFVLFWLIPRFPAGIQRFPHICRGIRMHMWTRPVSMQELWFQVLKLELLWNIFPYFIIGEKSKFTEPYIHMCNEHMLMI